MIKNRKHTKFLPQKRVRVDLPYPWYSESNVTKAGESAFKIRIPFYNNPFQAQPFKSWWIRGFKRAEKLYNEGIRLSMKIQETLPLEEVE